MLIRYTAAPFNNAVFSKTVWASRVCLCLIRLGQGSIVDGEDSAAKLKYSDEGPQCWSTYPLCCPWWFYSRGKKISHKCWHNCFFKSTKTASKIKCQVLLCYMVVAASWDSHRHKLKALDNTRATIWGKKNDLAQAWRVSPLHWSHSSVIPWWANIYCMVIQL